VARAATDPAKTHARCACCTGVLRVGDLIPLGAHPEVKVCERCARKLGERAKAMRRERHRRRRSQWLSFR
jgi:hypothetical protein